MSTTSSALSGSERTGSLNTILIVLLVLSIAFAAADFIYLTIKSNQDRQASALTTEIQVASQALTTYAANAAGGNELAFDELSKTTRDIDAFLGYLNKGNAPASTPYSGMPSYADEPGVAKELKDLNAAWEPVLTNATKILGGKSLVLDTATTSNEFSSKMPVLNSRMNEVVNILTERNGSAGQVYISTRQMLLADRMIRRVQEIGQGGDDAQSAADGFSRDAALYKSVLGGLIDGAPALNIKSIDQANARQILTDVSAQWDGLDEPVRKIIDASTGLQVVKQAADAIFTDSQSVLLKARNVADRLSTLGTKRTFPNPLWGGIAAAAAIVLVILLGITLVRDQQSRYQMSAELNQRNQEAILRLLDEMGSLAEGDLTVKATVTEDITGAIADSINFAVEALRSLVTTINETAVQVSAAAQETQATAMHLAEAAEHQAQQITSASAAINEIAVSIDEVSKNSSESAEVAQRSVQIAAKGAAIVRQTIQGMDSIRDQIQ
ncbi:MAG TPA: methyl-accepting chemotaxis protein, partial [Dokdonella sp.]|nr:methyl-accepting chemotaxis protein [Dokdonella sp.]HQX65671.1 methyl-accepting chemotaxis protein [Dokdonella sp.]